MAGSAPRELFGRAVFDRVRGMNPQDHHRYTRPGVGGTDPFGGLAQGALAAPAKRSTSTTATSPAASTPCGGGSASSAWSASRTPEGTDAGAAVVCGARGGGCTLAPMAQ
jgi:hypothetical protein